MLATFWGRAALSGSRVLSSRRICDRAVSACSCVLPARRFSERNATACSRVPASLRFFERSATAGSCVPPSWRVSGGESTEGSRVPPSRLLGGFRPRGGAYVPNGPIQRRAYLFLAGRLARSSLLSPIMSGSSAGLSGFRSGDVRPSGLTRSSLVSAIEAIPSTLVDICDVRARQSIFGAPRFPR